MDTEELPMADPQGAVERAMKKRVVQYQWSSGCLVFVSRSKRSRTSLPLAKVLRPTRS